MFDYNLWGWVKVALVFVMGWMACGSSGVCLQLAGMSEGGSGACLQSVGMSRGSLGFCLQPVGTG